MRRTWPRSASTPPRRRLERGAIARVSKAMCGVAGIYAYHHVASPVDAAELCRIRDQMAARGPDGAGVWHSDDRRIGLANRRLAIIDLSDRGLQPLASADGKLVITYNAEIYNYRQLRRRLESQVCVFRNDTDTGVLLHFCAQQGASMLGVLRGMLAFALWDANKQ